jgi:hypothetical protein
VTGTKSLIAQQEKSKEGESMIEEATWESSKVCFPGVIRENGQEIHTCRRRKGEKRQKNNGKV